MQAALRKAEEDLGSARASHQRYLEVALPAALEDAKATALAEYLESEDFRARLVAEYNDGMRDMKAGFIATNPTLVEVDWSFVPDWSDQTMAEEAAEVGEVTGEARLPEQPPSGAPEPAEQEQPLPLEQPVADLPSSPLMNPFWVVPGLWDLSKLDPGRVNLVGCAQVGSWSGNPDGLCPVIGPDLVVRGTREKLSPGRETPLDCAR
ncbi:hypothetical protein TIFTF001_054982, partial [Ficus carica]